MFKLLLQIPFSIQQGFREKMGCGSQLNVPGQSHLLPGVLFCAASPSAVTLMKICMGEKLVSKPLEDVHDLM